MLPKTQNLPIEGPQIAGAAAVSLTIRLHLLFPIGSVIYWQAITPRATVPKASIYKDCKFLVPEYEIWFSGKILMSAPASYSCFAEEFKKSTFCRCIPLRSNTRHIPGALFPCEPVWHWVSTLLYGFDLALANLPCSHSIKCNWSSTLARRTCCSSSMRSGLGGQFSRATNLSLSFRQSALKRLSAFLRLRKTVSLSNQMVNPRPLASEKDK
jgi:hypothetical protein